MSAPNSLNSYISQVKVSSVLNNDVKSFGKQYLLDDSLETCWNSDKGSPQYIALKLSQPIEISGFAIMFQGGFAAKSISIKTHELEFHPLNSNTLQYFNFPSKLAMDRILLEFPSSTDLFGRITVYKLDLY
jgi:hypothetical protein